MKLAAFIHLDEQICAIIRQRAVLFTPRAAQPTNCRDLEEKISRASQKHSWRDKVHPKTSTNTQQAS
jgi:hypothetical protein